MVAAALLLRHLPVRLGRRHARQALQPHLWLLILLAVALRLPLLVAQTVLVGRHPVALLLVVGMAVASPPHLPGVWTPPVLVRHPVLLPLALVVLAVASPLLLPVMRALPGRVRRPVLSPVLVVLAVAAP